MVFRLCNSHLKILELFYIVQKSSRFLNKGLLNYYIQYFFWGCFLNRCLITFESIECELKWQTAFCEIFRKI